MKNHSKDLLVGFASTDLPGMEFVFFIVALMVLCFRFTTKALEITHRSFSCTKAFSTPHTILASRLRVSKRLRENTAGTVDPR